MLFMEVLGALAALREPMPKDEKSLEDMSDPEIKAKLEQMREEGLVEEVAPGRWRLTDKGRRDTENRLLKLPNA